MDRGYVAVPRRVAAAARRGVEVRPARYRSGSMTRDKKHDEPVTLEDLEALSEPGYEFTDDEDEHE